MAARITLYLATNTENGKTYVGVTGHRDLRRRMSDGGHRFEYVEGVA
jgi:hypothetical protein